MAQTVVVGYVHGDQLTQEFHHCLSRLFIHDAWGPRRILTFCPQYSGTQINGARNQMVREMLDRPDATHLLMLDSDAAFGADVLDRLLAHDVPIVGALAHRVRHKQDSNGHPIIDVTGAAIREIVPVVYKTIYGPDGKYVGYQELETYGHGLLEADATGCHTLLVKREVFEAIEADHPHRWFREELTESGVLTGEDITFCLAARRVGYAVHVDTTLESGHVKPFIMTSRGAQ